MQDIDPQKLASYTGPRPDVISLIKGDPMRVLDVGCSNGALLSNLRRSGTETWGIEIDPYLAEMAESRVDHVLVGDALELVTQLAADEATFDTIVCADSLEHMVDPWGVLRLLRDMISDDGQVVVSLPNVRFYTTLVWLVFKRRWRYLERGVHDRTHLRWFTDLNARDMFVETGFQVEEVTTHYRILDSPATRWNTLAPYLAVGPLRGFLAYQYVYRLTPAPR